MTANIGYADRVLRLCLGLALVALPFIDLLPLWETPALAYGTAFVGLILFSTALFRFCPLYRVLGISTNKVQ